MGQGRHWCVVVARQQGGVCAALHALCVAASGGRREGVRR